LQQLGEQRSRSAEYRGAWQNQGKLSELTSCVFHRTLLQRRPAFRAMRAFLPRTRRRFVSQNVGPHRFPTMKQQPDAILQKIG